jgi:hypothetical protein
MDARLPEWNKGKPFFHKAFELVAKKARKLGYVWIR